MGLLFQDDWRGEAGDQPVAPTDRLSSPEFSMLPVAGTRPVADAFLISVGSSAIVFFSRGDRKQGRNRSRLSPGEKVISPRTCRSKITTYRQEGRWQLHSGNGQSVYQPECLIAYPAGNLPARYPSPFPGITGRADTRFAIQGIYLQTGIIRQGEKSAGPAKAIALRRAFSS